MRLAWVYEHLQANTPILSLFRASRLDTMRGLVEVIAAWAPPPSDDPVRFARDLRALHQGAGGGG